METEDALFSFSKEGCSSRLRDFSSEERSIEKQVLPIGVKVMQKDTRQNRTILVTGATGHQGGAVVRSLSAHGWKVRALVRDPSMPAAQQLAKNTIELIQGDLFTTAALEEALKGVYGVFSVQTSFAEHGIGGEIIQGKLLADAAHRAQVQHFVYSSAGNIVT
jgi:nucleoside-diphosphate-sugar epimerase